VSPSGVVLMIAGVWVLSQVFAGNALTRLNILTPADPVQGFIRTPGGTGAPAATTVPGGLPNIDYGSLINRTGG
jgi:hypothetical protein